MLGNMDTKAAKGKWRLVSSLIKDKMSNHKRSDILLTKSECPTQKLRSLYGRGISLDRSDSFESKYIEQEQKRNEKIRMGREERRQKHDLAEEKREVFRTQIRQKYGIKSKEEAELDKNVSKSYEASFRSYITTDFFKSNDKLEKKKNSTNSSRETRE